MPDAESVIAASARFWMAWTAAIQCDGDDLDGDDLPSVERVIEVHEAARELIRATGTKNLRAAYDVLDTLVLDIKASYPVQS